MKNMTAKATGIYWELDETSDTDATAVQSFTVELLREQVRARMIREGWLAVPAFVESCSEQELVNVMGGAL